MFDQFAHHALTQLTDRAVYPESPRWRDGLLWFSDVHDFTVKTVEETGHVSVVTKVPGRPAGLGFLPDGRLLVASALDQRLHVWDGEALSPYADLAPVCRGLLNDMVVDHTGRAYVGDTGYNLMAGEQAKPGQLLLVEPPDHAAPVIRVVADDVHFPNGAAISDDGRHLWLAESTADRVSVFDVSEDGSLSRARTFHVPGFPDGLCLDVDHGAWVALLRSGEFRHLAADGTNDQTVAVPGHLAIACALGGHDRRTLHLCSAATSMAELARGHSSGVISTMRVQRPGAGLP